MEVTTKPADSSGATDKHRSGSKKMYASESVKKKVIFDVKKMAKDAEQVYQHVRGGGKLEELRETKSV